MSLLCTGRAINFLWVNHGPARVDVFCVPPQLPREGRITSLCVSLLAGRGTFSEKLLKHGNSTLRCEEEDSLVSKVELVESVAAVLHGRALGSLLFSSCCIGVKISETCCTRVFCRSFKSCRHSLCRCLDFQDCSRVTSVCSRAGRPLISLVANCKSSRSLSKFTSLSISCCLASCSCPQAAVKVVQVTFRSVRLQNISLRTCSTSIFFSSSFL